jgi:hypothetical protein
MNQKINRIALGLFILCADVTAFGMDSDQDCYPIQKSVGPGMWAKRVESYLSPDLGGTKATFYNQGIYWDEYSASRYSAPRDGHWHLHSEPIDDPQGQYFTELKSLYLMQEERRRLEKKAQFLKKMGGLLNEPHLLKILGKFLDYSAIYD